MKNNSKFGIIKNKLFQNILLLIATILILIVSLEFIIFKYIFAPCEIPRNIFTENIIKYKPNQKGIFRKKDELKAHYRINEQGWNSGHKKYNIAKQEGVYRIAVIGDSYIEAFQVNYDNSLAEKLEKKLNFPNEVYRFGTSGAPLSQYYYMLKNEVIKYSPDVVIFNLVHNDFDQSFNLKLGRYTHSFFRLNIKGDCVEEILPKPYEDNFFYMTLRGSNIFRYFHDREGFRFDNIRDKVIRMLNKDVADKYYEANVNIQSLREKYDKIELAVDYLFNKIKYISEKHGIKILIVMDGIRQNIYDDSPINPDTESYRLNIIANELSNKNSLSFIDMHPLFYSDYKKNKMRFEYKSDGHWNEYAHQFVSETIAAFIIQNRSKN